MGCLICYLERVRVVVRYEYGTLVVSHIPEECDGLREILVEDVRTGRFRAPGKSYRELMLALRDAGVEYEDLARAYEPISVDVSEKLKPYPYQAKALEAWRANRFSGVVQMPTGSGKTILGALAVSKAKRPALIVVPTIELLGQWQATLQKQLGVEVGVIGGGIKDWRPITVITYDSAARQVEFFGNKFGLLIFDECHHLPSNAYKFIAEASIAPFRLGLSATVERPDGLEQEVFRLLGSLILDVDIESLEGKYLSSFDVITVAVVLDDEEMEIYREARAKYLDFLRSQSINFNDKAAWGQFVMRAHQTTEGKAAYAAYRLQRSIALASKAKLDALWKILLKHNKERILVFADNNEIVYQIASQFYLPALTYQTRPAERKELLSMFADGSLRVLVTAKVLNEGVDVPDASIAVVLSGSGSVREHVQRLGRILRRKDGKHAILYEVVSDVAAEAGISERRRQHEAYLRA